jgi:glucose-fructose oxidoreductase
MSRTLLIRLGCCLLLSAAVARAQQTAPAAGAHLSVAIVGLVHGHVQGWFSGLRDHPEIELVGVAEPDPALRAHYAEQYHLPSAIFFATEAELLQHTHPQAVLVYTSIAGHRAAIEQAARLHIASMVEKPLSTTYADALAIQKASEEYHVPVLVNYETTWYASNTAAAKLLWSGQIGGMRKLVARDGHEGPKEIGVGPEFLNWLTDPEQNGAGALFDFGCYGVDLATWLMHGQAPISVTAVTQTDKPKVYPKVDDEATIILRYPQAQAIVQGSWNWPFAIKDLQVYGATGYIDTVAADGLRMRLPGEPVEHAKPAEPLAAPEDTALHYLAAVLRGEVTPRGDLSSLDTNVTVMKILDAARESARTGKTIELR